MNYTTFSRDQLRTECRRQLGWSTKQSRSATKAELLAALAQHARPVQPEPLPQPTAEPIAEPINNPWDGDYFFTQQRPGPESLYEFAEQLNQLYAASGRLLSPAAEPISQADTPAPVSNESQRVKTEIDPIPDPLPSWNDLWHSVYLAVCVAIASIVWLTRATARVWRSPQAVSIRRSMLSLLRKAYRDAERQFVQAAGLAITR